MTRPFGADMCGPDVSAGIIPVGSIVLVFLGGPVCKARRRLIPFPFGPSFAYVV